MRLGSLLCLLCALAGIAAAQDTNFSVGPQYLMTNGSPLFARPITTPSLSLSAPLPGIPSLPEIGPPVSDQPFTANPELPGQADLFPIYYGTPLPSVIEISAEPPRALPASMVDVGVEATTDAQSLRELGYGVTLSETASFWKTHMSHATRVYTNRDIARLHGG